MKSGWRLVSKDKSGTVRLMQVEMSDQEIKDNPGLWKRLSTMGTPFDEEAKP